MRPSTRTGVLVAAAIVWTACGGDDGPTGPRLDDLQITIESGNGQFAAPGAELASPLRVLVTETIGEEPVEGIEIAWSVVEGGGATLSRDTAVTGSDGIASTSVTLGPGLGVYTVRASFARGTPTSGPVFTATAARAPEITRLPGGPVDAGDTIVVEGRNFGPTPADHAVLFAGIEGRVLSGTTTSLEVEVPACVPSREVDVVVRLGELESAPARLTVVAGTGTLDLAPGEALISPDAAVLSCIRLPAESDVAYLLVPQSASTTGGAVFPYRIQGFGESAVTVAAGVSRARGGRGREVGSGAGPDRVVPADLPGPAQSRFEAGLRASERRMAPARLPEPSPGRSAGAPPELGDRMDFNVVNKDNEFEPVTGEVVHVSERAVIYEDVTVPDGGLTTPDYRNFGDLFDDPIHATDVDAFGQPSDIDGNGRIIILFTPVVNRMTEEGSDGFIAGFFFGCDLVTRDECSGTNRAEIFYAMVPDPDGEFGDARSTELVLRVVPAVLAHEFQHMIHFNERVLEGGAPSTESLWLSEGLAHMAEDLVGDALLERGDTARAGDFKLSNFVRARRYLERPADVSLIASSQFGSLEERGAAWLYTRYLYEHLGGLAILRSLTQTTLSSVTNVEAQTGRSWEGLMGEWAPALYLDDLDATVETRFTYPDLRIRTVLGQFQGGFPLQPPSVGFRDFTLSRELAASGADFILLEAGSSPDRLHLNIAAEDGTALPDGAAAQVTLIRIR